MCFRFSWFFCTPPVTRCRQPVSAAPTAAVAGDRCCSRTGGCAWAGACSFAVPRGSLCSCSSHPRAHQLSVCGGSSAPQSQCRTLPLSSRPWFTSSRQRLRGLGQQSRPPSLSISGLLKAAEFPWGCACLAGREVSCGGCSSPCRPSQHPLHTGVQLRGPALCSLWKY